MLLDTVCGCRKEIFCSLDTHLNVTHHIARKTETTNRNTMLTRVYVVEVATLVDL